MKKIVLTLTAVLIFGWQGLSLADTSSVDALIQKLEDKGILTTQDAQQLQGQIAASEQTSQQTTFKSLLPDWVNGLKITGDFRLRDQYQRIDVANGSASNKAGYNRGRLRARLNFEDQINDKVKVIFGIATNGENPAGVGNPRSNNLTLGGNNAPSEDAFNKPEAVINKAYAVYAPASWATLEGGKMDNPIWEPISGNAQLLWDPNITPEGGVVQLQKKINDYITPFATNALFVIADTGSSPAVGNSAAAHTDPYLFISQAGIKGSVEKFYYKTAVSYYEVSNPSREVFGNRPSATSSTATSDNTNSTNLGATQYDYNYYLIGGAAEVGINDPFGDMLPSPIHIPQVGIIGQLFDNYDVSHNGYSWEMGAYMGNSQLNGWGTWKLQSVYKVLERDSWLDIFPDADDYNGATDTAAYRTEFDLGLAKNVWCALTYYHVNVFKDFSDINETSGESTAFSHSAPENMYQMDVNFKF